MKEQPYSLVEYLILQRLKWNTWVIWKYVILGGVALIGYTFIHELNSKDNIHSTLPFQILSHQFKFNFEIAIIITPTESMLHILL